MSVAKWAVALLVVFVAQKGCSTAREASTRRAERQMQQARQQALDAAPGSVSAAQLPEVAVQPDPHAAIQKRVDAANASRRLGSGAAPAASGWVTGEQAEDQKRLLDAEGQRQLAERRVAQGVPTSASSGSPSPGAQRRAAGLANYADCNQARSRIRIIREAQKSGATVQALSLEGSGVRTVNKAEAAAILAESERFVAEKCRQ